MMREIEYEFAMLMRRHARSDDDLRRFKQIVERVLEEEIMYRCFDNHAKTEAKWDAHRRALHARLVAAGAVR